MQHFYIAAGGTGGHIYPGIAIAKALEEKGHSVVWLGTKDGMEARCVPQHNIAFRSIVFQGIRGHSKWRWMMLPWRLLRAMTVIARYFYAQPPAAVICMGGYVAFPAGILARLRRIPLIVHEQNTKMGLVNRVLSRRATRVLWGLSLDKGGHRTVSGNPVLRQPKGSGKPAEKSDAFRILIVGGSQGAQFINVNMPLIMAKLAQKYPIEIWHQAGRKKKKETEDLYVPKMTVRVDEFIDDMSKAYEWADCVIGRSGAMTVSELALWGKPSVLIPLPTSADNHQYTNALVLQKEGAAVIVDQNKWDESEILERLLLWAQSLDDRKKAADAARSVAKPHAVTEIVQAIESCCKKGVFEVD